MHVDDEEVAGSSRKVEENDFSFASLFFISTHLGERDLILSSFFVSTLFVHSFGELFW